RAWIGDLVDTHGSITYYPHRRETDTFLTDLARDDRVRIKHVGLPIELRLVNLPPGSTIRSLPSTAAVSLAVLNPDVTISVTEIPAHWWTGASPDSLRKSLNAQTVKADVESLFIGPTHRLIDAAAAPISWLRNHPHPLGLRLQVLPLF